MLYSHAASEYDLSVRFSSYFLVINDFLLLFIHSGLPPRYRDSVRAITPGLPLFLYNYTTHQLHGIFEVRSEA